jgi:hypothetical protein
MCNKRYLFDMWSSVDFFNNLPCEMLSSVWAKKAQVMGQIVNSAHKKYA